MITMCTFQMWKYQLTRRIAEKYSSRFCKDSSSALRPSSKSSSSFSGSGVSLSRSDQWSKNHPYFLIHRRVMKLYKVEEDLPSRHSCHWAERSSKNLNFV